MKLWTMLASLVVAGVIASGAYAQEKKKGERKRGPQFNITELVKDGKIAKADYIAARTKNAPEDRKEEAKKRAEESWKRMAGDKDSITEQEWKDAREKMMKAWKDKGGKREGGKREGGKKKAA